MCRYFQNGSASAPSPLFSYLPSSCPTTPWSAAPSAISPPVRWACRPCHWIAGAYNPNGGTGLCVGQPDVCEPLTQDQCNAIDRSTPAAGGWSSYVLPMTKYGPVIATEFGSFDCSSPFVTEFMSYSDSYDVSYTACGPWPQNNGGTLNMGSMLLPGHQRGLSRPQPALPDRLQGLSQSCELCAGHGPADALGRPGHFR